MTKAELNAQLASPLSASKLKKTSLEDLKAMIAAEKQKPRGLEDRIICEPAARLDDVKPTRGGSKRAKLIEALEKGATVKELMAAVGWNRSTTLSALRTDLRPLGLGCERRDGRYFLLLPDGLKKAPITEAGQTRADALVAACK